jgi:hypothetical protein
MDGSDKGEGELPDATYEEREAWLHAGLDLGAQTIFNQKNEYELYRLRLFKVYYNVPIKLPSNQFASGVYKWEADSADKILYDALSKAPLGPRAYEVWRNFLTQDISHKDFGYKFTTAKLLRAMERNPDVFMSAERFQEIQALKRASPNYHDNLNEPVGDGNTTSPTPLTKVRVITRAEPYGVWPEKQAGC